MTRWFRVAACTTLLFAAALARVADAQTRYATGQNVGPVFEGWTGNPDGSLSFVFGYLNRNYEEILDVPVGPNNRCEPGPADCGQPTHFLTRRQRFVFTVPVPKGWDPKAVMRWSVTSNGKTDAAKAWLHPEMEISYDVMSENNGGGIIEDGNTPPKVIQGSAKQTIAASQSVTLSVSIGDDGLPNRRGGRETQQILPTDPPANPAARAAAAAAAEARRPGVRIRWMKYRGPGTVTFDPETTPPVHGKPAESMTKASFSTPGTYVVRALATDGQLQAAHDVTVIVQ